VVPLPLGLASGADNGVNRSAAEPTVRIRFPPPRPRDPEETEYLNAIGKLDNLLLAVLTGVGRIRLDIADRSVDDREPLLGTPWWIGRSIHPKITPALLAAAVLHRP